MKHAPYSYTKLNMYDECPQKFAFRYIEGRKTPITKPLVLGNVYHKFAEILDKMRIVAKNGSPISDKDKIRLVFLDEEKAQSKVIKLELDDSGAVAKTVRSKKEDEDESNRLSACISKTISFIKKSSKASVVCRYISGRQ